MTTRKSGETVESSDYLAVSLCISSKRLAPETITRAIGIEPSYTRALGARTRTGLLRRPEFDLNEWQFREQVDINSGEDVGELSKHFISLFLSRTKEAAPTIRELSRDEDVLIQIVYSVHSMPYLGLSNEHIQQIASLGARLDYDLMVGD